MTIKNAVPKTWVKGSDLTLGSDGRYYSDPAAAPSPENYSHGDIAALVVSGSGSKADNNAGGYLFQGAVHTNVRATDFDNATEQYDSTNNESSWAVALDGIIPAASEAFFSDATVSKTYVQLTGGPTVSGKYLRRQADAAAKVQGNYRLKNWKLYGNDGTYRPVYYRSVMIYMPYGDSGKYVREFWEDEGAGAGTRQNLYVSKSAASNQAAWNLEYSDNANPSVGYCDFDSDFSAWQRVETLIDFQNNEYWNKIDGQLLVDVSNSHTGVISGFLNNNPGDCVLEYCELGNTLDQETSESGGFIGWANPYMDFSEKRIEICASSTYDGALAVPQPIKSWVDDDVEIIVNRGHLTNEQLAGSYVFYINNLTVTSLGALNG